MYKALSEETIRNFTYFFGKKKEMTTKRKNHHVPSQALHEVPFICLRKFLVLWPSIPF
jgi:hypothetical protein